MSVIAKLWSAGSQARPARRGFTLIELLIVIVVLGILAAIVVFSLTGVTGQSKQAACTTDAKSVEVAADAYQANDRQLASNDWRSGTGDGSYLQTAPVPTNGYTISIGALRQRAVHANRGIGDASSIDATGCAGIS